MSESSIVKSAESALAELKPIFGVVKVDDKTSLSQSEVDTLSVELFAEKAALKQLKTAVDERLEEVKGAMIRQTGSEIPEALTLYSVDNSLKLQLTTADIGGGYDSSKLLAALYASFGEEPGDTSGEAWKVWCKVSDPIQTRTLNAGKLEYELSKSLEAAHGIKHGSTSLYIPVEAVTAADVPATKQYRFNGAVKMTAAEVKAAKEGTL